MKLAVILGNLGNTCDRFLSSGYKEQPTKAEMFKQASEIKGVTGIELVGSWDITTKNINEVKSIMDDCSLECVSIIPDLFSDKKWGNGAFTSRDPVIRKKAIAATKEMIDAVVELGGNLINLWPGQDGYDYCFQGNFLEMRDFFVDGIVECAKYKPEVKISLEYKVKEPRTHSYLARAADTLLMALDTKCDNVGVTIDVGHSLMAYENVAESIALISRYDKLFHMHFNDNYRSWDDDMMVGSVHMVEYLEILFWLDKINFDGWYSMDQYPYREDAKGAINESIRWVEGLHNKMVDFGMDKFGKLLEKGEAIEGSMLIRDFIGI